MTIMTQVPDNRTARFAAHNIFGMNGFDIANADHVEVWLQLLISSCDRTAPDSRIPILFRRVQELMLKWQNDRQKERVEMANLYAISQQLLPLILSFANEMPQLPKGEIKSHVEQIHLALKRYKNISNNRFLFAKERLLAQRYWLAVADRENQAIKHIDLPLYAFYRILCFEHHSHTWRPAYRRTLLKLAPLDEQRFGLSCQSRITDYDNRIEPLLRSAQPISLLPLKRKRNQAESEGDVLDIESAHLEKRVKSALREAIGPLRENKLEAARPALLRAEIALYQLQQMRGKHHLTVTRLSMRLLELNNSSGLPCYLRAVARHIKAEREITGEVAYCILHHLGRRGELIMALSPEDQPHAAWASLRELADVIGSVQQELSHEA